jgi:hypothetical protein
MKLGSLWLVGIALCAVACAGKSAGGEDPSTGAAQDLKTTTAPPPPDGLTPAQTTNVLNLIDDHCGDAWCESDLDYSFDTFTCTFATGACTMSFVAIDKDTQSQHPLSCTFSGLKSFNDIVDTFPNGASDLVGSFFGQVDKCVTDKSTGL